MNYDFKKHISSKIFKVIAYASAELGYKSYVIGGYVRDILLRRPSNDIDVVTVGSGITLAKKVASLLPGHKEAKYYGAFGTAMIRFDGMEVEFVGARKAHRQPDAEEQITICSECLCTSKTFRRNDGKCSVILSDRYQYRNLPRLWH